MLRIKGMVDTETRANRKAMDKRFQDRRVYVVTDRSGVDHCLLAPSIKGTISMVKSFDPRTQRMTTIRNDGSGVAGWRLDGE